MQVSIGIVESMSLFRKARPGQRPRQFLLDLAFILLRTFFHQLDYPSQYNSRIMTFARNITDNELSKICMTMVRWGPSTQLKSHLPSLPIILLTCSVPSSSSSALMLDSINQCLPQEQFFSICTGTRPRNKYSVTLSELAFNLFLDSK
jgi:hypothetical protein